MPFSYRKAEDPVVDNMDQSNQQRKSEIHTHQKVVDKLEQQLVITTEIMKGAKKEKDVARNELDRIRKKDQITTEKIDEFPALTAVNNISNEKDIVLPDRTRSSVTSSWSVTMDYKRAPAGTMTELLKKLS